MNRKGFTLIELLIIIAIIGFLAAAILVAVDPVKRIGDSRDARRSAESNAILNAILTWQVDERAMFDGGLWNGTEFDSAPILTDDGIIGNGSQVIVDGTGTNVVCANLQTACPDAGALNTVESADVNATLDTAGNTMCIADLGELVDDGYIAQLPIDPACAEAGCTSTAGTHTGYYIHRSDLGGSGKVRIEIGNCDAEYATSIKVAR